METEYQYLLHLLGAYLLEREPEKREDIDWDRLLQLGQLHSVVGILGYMGKKYPLCDDPKKNAYLRSLCLNTIGIFAQKHAGAQALAAGLEEAGIDHILMKGYVLRDFYPVPELRTFNDVDLVIRPEDRRRCDEWMLAQDFQRHTDWEPVYSYVRGQEYYEIHTDIMEIDVSDKADYQGYFRTMWDHARPVSPHSYRFTPEFHFLYLLTHIAKHVHGSGAGIRMYLDAAAFVRHHGDSLDWDWVDSQLKMLKLDRFAAVVFSAVEHWFGVSAPMVHETVPEQVLEEFLQFTLEAGTFGHHQREEALNSLKNAENTPKIRQILKETFPSARTIEKRYTYLQDKPWLLPAAWVHRLVKNKDKLGQRTRKMQQILRADTEEVQKLRDLMQDIGL